MFMTVVDLKNYIGNLISIDDALDPLQSGRYKLAELYRKALEAVRNNNHHIDSHYRDFTEFLGRLIDICILLEAPKELKQKLNMLLARLKEPIGKNKKTAKKLLNDKTFTEFVDEIKRLIKRIVERSASQLGSLDPLERDRINAAIHCYFEGLPYASAAMAIVAIEYRLMRLMAGAKPEEEEELKELTLGQLIRRYLENLKRYVIDSKPIIPHEHKSVLLWINDVRVFSVHPKHVKIDLHIARDVLSRALHFLLATAETLKAIELRAIRRELSEEEHYKESPISSLNT